MTRTSAGVNAINDPSFFGIVGRHLNLHLVTSDETDETLAHFTGDVGEHEVSILQLYTEHRSGKYCVDCSFEFYCIFVLSHNCQRPEPEAPNVAQL